MSFDHKAYLFRHDAYCRELRPLLAHALAHDEVETLVRFIDQHRTSMTDPYDGLPLPADWESALEGGDVQEYADHALTRYYDVHDSIGLASAWQRLDEALALHGLSACLLGEPLIARDEHGGEHVFDPGRMGAYFQPPLLVRANLARLARASSHVECPPDLVTRARSMLEVALASGLYVTF